MRVTAEYPSQALWPETSRSEASTAIGHLARDILPHVGSGSRSQSIMTSCEEGLSFFRLLPGYAQWPEAALKAGAQAEDAHAVQHEMDDPCADVRRIPQNVAQTADRGGLGRVWGWGMNRPAV